MVETPFVDDTIASTFRVLVFQYTMRFVYRVVRSYFLLFLLRAIDDTT